MNIDGVNVDGVNVGGATVDYDVLIVGAGIAGLTAAHELHRAGLHLRVLEAEDHVGGRMTTFRHDGYSVDIGAEQIGSRGYRATWELLHRNGIASHEVPRIGRPLAMWREGAAHPWVADPRGFFTGAGLSHRARLDLARCQGRAALHRAEFDTDHPERSPLSRLTVAEFARRYHPELHDYLFQPVASSFFGWDTGRSAASVLMNLLREVGSAGTWRTYRGGMDLLARTLAESLPVSTGVGVREVAAEGEMARVVLDDEVLTARAVLLCVPAPVAAELHANPPEVEADFLAACSFTPALKVSCLLDRPLAPVCPASPYILLTPQREEDVLGAIIVDHLKLSDRAPAGRGLLSVMARADTVPDLLDAPDEEVVERLTRAAADYVPGLRAATRENFVHRFRHALPEATPEALRRRPAFAARPIGPVDYAGDWVSLRPASEGAVRAGASAASRVLRHLGSNHTRRVAVEESR